MEERVTHGSASELADAANRMKQLADEVNRLNQDLVMWKLSIDIDVEPDGDKFEIVVSVKGRDGMTLYIMQEHILYMANDKAGLVSEIAQRIVDDCLLSVVKENIAHRLGRAVDNVVRLTSKKSGLS
jgi:hypothetical protein